MQSKCVPFSRHDGTMPVSFTGCQSHSSDYKLMTAYPSAPPSSSSSSSSPFPSSSPPPPGICKEKGDLSLLEAGQVWPHLKIISSESCVDPSQSRGERYYRRFTRWSCFALFVGSTVENKTGKCMIVDTS